MLKMMINMILFIFLLFHISAGEYLNFTADFEVETALSDGCDEACELEFYQNITNTACDGFYNCYATIEGVKIEPEVTQEPPDIEITECTDKD